ncbi:MAG: GNAT family N-acetyltransferase [Rhizobiaceae bacterium]|nr:GNAT family N-acetyltransferase [Rhizobiaceae bacterium]
MATAALAQRALGESAPHADYFDWLSGADAPTPAIQIGAWQDDEKVGHIAIIARPVRHKGRTLRAAEVVDLFVDPPHRSLIATQRLYQAAMRQIRLAGFDLILAMPNKDATGMDQFFMKVKPTRKLAITAMPAVTFAKRGEQIAANAAALNAYLLADATDGMIWTAETLARRLARPDRNYLLRADTDTLVIASPRTLKGVPMALICGVFQRVGAAVAPGRVHALCASAARDAGRHGYLYVGTNEALGSAPGLPFPDAFRPSPMLLHVAALTPEAEGFNPNRFEAIDFDFA